ncbi:MAG: YicC family protein [Candidatus Omnitrophica bacterium]|nr:YicC family protein [Candidatus Omnitrophota bacterium]
MVVSMTGFGGGEIKSSPFGKINVELRSTNHKFLEIVLHLPEGFLPLEERIKKAIEARLRRGRVTCVVNISAAPASDICINQSLLQKYAVVLKAIEKQFRLKNDLTAEALIRLPGVLSLEDKGVNKAAAWLKLEALLARALNDLVQMRRKEGRALAGFLKKGALKIQSELEAVHARFQKAVKNKVSRLASDEERANFLKDADIAEELDRLSFHIKNFLQKLTKDCAVGKELDFIAQEMQREANTMGAKSFDAEISGMAVQLKSQIEKLREQVQNIE